MAAPNPEPGQVRQTMQRIRAFGRSGAAWMGGAIFTVGAVGYAYHRAQKALEASEEKFEELPYLGPQEKLRPTLVLGTSNVILGNSWHAPASRLFTFRRPGLDTLLDRLKDKYEVVLYSTSDYAHSQELRARIDPKSKSIKEFVSRDVEDLRDDQAKAAVLERRKEKYQSLTSGVSTGSMYEEETKDITNRIKSEKPQKQLRDLGRPMHRLVLIDCVENMDFPYNTIVIPPWDGSDANDRELFNVIPMLEALAAEKTDIRPKIRQTKQQAKMEEKSTAIVWLENNQPKKPGFGASVIDDAKEAKKVRSLVI